MEQRSHTCGVLSGLACQPYRSELEYTIRRYEKAMAHDRAISMKRALRAYLTRTLHFIQTTASSHHLIEGANNAFLVEIAFQQKWRALITAT